MPSLQYTAPQARIAAAMNSAQSTAPAMAKGLLARCAERANSRDPAVPAVPAASSAGVLPLARRARSRPKRGTRLKGTTSRNVVQAASSGKVPRCPSGAKNMLP